MNKIVLILGSNLGNKEQNISTALNLISNLGTISQQSEWIETKPEDYVSTNNFINMGIVLNSTISPSKLLLKLKQIEKDLGRKKDSSESISYEDRIIDIDIIKYNSINFKSNKLKIPHFKHTYLRNFSLVILKQLL